MKQLLTQNSKLKKDGIFNFDIPAYQSKTGLITCPNAKTCIANCYARQGTYRFSNVAAKHEWNLEQALKDDFVQVMTQEIKKRKVKIFRWFSSGDFFSKDFVLKAFQIMNDSPQVQFYAYTKSWDLFEGLELPKNFKFIQSDGGKLEVDKSKPHSVVYNSKEVMPSDYNDASDSDLVAVNSNKVGLVYHGTKKVVNNGFVKTN
jgi:hypothetical protein